ncbi:substrate-binding periplasmic protein [Aliagarivorans marinus]|uniref:substrate-binding periplasmic protein n=1 Tax=Aliagarivorans marinus TaxID=561965 RepID=UPI00047C4C82|nr:transporter substrate-binding domain-containing protein [Aliagarivorans marinus]
MLLLCLASLPAKPFSVATEQWQDYSNSDLSGYYFSILNRIFPERDYEVSFVPYLRSIALVRYAAVDMAMGISPDAIPAQFCSPYLVGLETADLALSQELAENWSGLDDLKGKRVYGRLGYDWADTLPASTDYHELADLAVILKLLNSRRIDAVIDYRVDMESTLQQANLGQGFVFIDNVVEFPIHFCFSLSERGQQLRAQFEDEMKALIDSGELRQIMIDTLGSDIEYPY